MILQVFFNLSKLLLEKRLFVPGYEKRRLWAHIACYNFIFILSGFVIIIFCIPESLLLGILSMPRTDIVTEAKVRNEWLPPCGVS